MKEIKKMGPEELLDHIHGGLSCIDVYLEKWEGDTMLRRNLETIDKMVYDIVMELVWEAE
jgi:hypothetical protein